MRQVANMCATIPVGRCRAISGLVTDSSSCRRHKRARERQPRNIKSIVNTERRLLAVSTRSVVERKPLDFIPPAVAFQYKQTSPATRPLCFPRFSYGDRIIRSASLTTWKRTTRRADVRHTVASWTRTRSDVT